MLKIENSVCSFDILEKEFSCNIKKCKGACCVLGDSGAPLEDHEVEILRNVFPNIEPYMSDKGIKAVKMQGTSVIDKDGDHVTTLINHKECAYVVFEDGIAICAIEKAYEAKAISFQKPVSCHLYPIRITKYKDFEALNYHEWDICKPALDLGHKKKVPLFQYLSVPLIRKYGKSWFDKLEIASKEVFKYLEKK
jgi:Protein of unknown function (DUF3109)